MSFASNKQKYVTSLLYTSAYAQAVGGPLKMLFIVLEGWYGQNMAIFVLVLNCLCDMVLYSKNHQRALESMQASFEAEARGKVEALKSKKKLEQDINELEVALDAANRGRAEAEKNIKKLQQQIRDIQQVINSFIKKNFLGNCHFICMCHSTV